MTALVNFEPIAIVTGGGLAIGRAAALALAKSGAKASVVDIGTEGGSETVDGYPHVCRPKTC